MHILFLVCSRYLRIIHIYSATVTVLSDWLYTNIFLTLFPNMCLINTYCWIILVQYFHFLIYSGRSLRYIGNSIIRYDCYSLFVFNLLRTSHQELVYPFHCFWEGLVCEFCEINFVDSLHLLSSQMFNKVYRFVFTYLCCVFSSKCLRFYCSLISNGLYCWVIFCASPATDYIDLS